MAHCGYEPTAANLAITKPLKALKIALFGVRTDGPMAPEISLANQRPAKYNFAEQVEKTLTELKAEKAKKDAEKAALAAKAAAQQPAPHHLTAAE
jgi:hypothetical protein